MDCGCGRSPTGKCIGWHKLSEEEFQEELKSIRLKTKKLVLKRKFFSRVYLLSALNSFL